MLIVEGADLVGKTTLAKRLAKALNDRGWPHVYRHLSRLPSELWRRGYKSPLELHEDLASRFVVADRFHMSEPMYALARGEESTLSPTAYELLDARLKGRLGAFTVVVVDATEDAQVIRRRWRPGEMFDLETVVRVNAQYLQLATARDRRWGKYYMDYDAVVAAGDGETPIDETLDRYCDRQRVLETVR